MSTLGPPWVNNPDRGLGLPASAARSDLTQPRTSSRYGLMFWLSRGATGPRERIRPDNLLHRLSRYTSLRVGSSTLKTCPYYEQHNISLLQTRLRKKNQEIPRTGGGVAKGRQRHLVATLDNTQ